MDLEEEISRALSVEDGAKPTARYFFEGQFSRITAFLDGRILPPRSVEVQTSSFCNANCFFCWGKERKLQNLLCEMDNMKIVIQKIIDAEVDGLKVESVKFVGSTGDPLGSLRASRATLYAINALAKENIQTRMFTNGIGLKRIMLDDINALDKLDYIRISLDADCEDTWRKVKRVKGEFDNIIRSIEKLRNVSKEEGTYIDIGYVICSENFRGIEDAARIVKDAGAHGIQYRMDLLNSSFSSEIPEAIAERLTSVQSMSDNSFDVIWEYDPEPLCKKCYYPFFWTTVGSDGLLYACGHTALSFGSSDHSMGNLLGEGSLMDLISCQRRDPRTRCLPNSHCEVCPPVGFHTSRLMAFLEDNYELPGFQQALLDVH